MTLDPPKNPEYAATVVRVKTLDPLAGCDNIVGLPMFGYQAIVGADTQIGDLGIVFPAECQLAEEFVRENNLYRHNTYNVDPEKKGYLEDNRRVRAIRLRNHRSDALFMPLGSLDYLGGSAEGLPSYWLNEGDTFDALWGHEVCRKYLRPHQGGGSGVSASNPRLTFHRVEERLFPEHIDTANFFRVDRNLDPDTHVTVTQKLHGASIRIGHISVRRKLRLRERLARRLGVQVQDREHAYVYGSHHVVKDADNPHQTHFYNEDIWTAEGRRLVGRVPRDFIVYGELVGWTKDNGPIQKGYTYNAPEREARLYVYRVTHVNPDGLQTDLGWPQLVEFCRLADLEPVRLMYEGPLGNFHPEQVLDKDFRQLGYDTVPLATTSACDEGVVIRIEGIRPQVYKAKSPLFLNHETRMIDKGEADMEEVA